MEAILNPALHTRTFTVGGKEYSVAFDFNAIAEAEAATKLNILTMFIDPTDVNALQLRGLLYASQRPPKKLSLESAGDVLQAAIAEGKLNDVVTAIFGSLSDSQPKAVDKEEAPDPNGNQAQS